MTSLKAIQMENIFKATVLLVLIVATLIVTIEAKRGITDRTQVENNVSIATVPSDVTCNMILTQRLQLNYQCIVRLKARTRELSPRSLMECKRACCTFNDDPCDMVYWIRNEKCVLMNYYVLNLCPLSTATDDDSASLHTLLLGISNRAIPYVKQQLLSEHRQDVQTMLGCNNNQFVCDNWNCIKKKFYCDGSPQCSDRSDELSCETSGNMRCLGYDGKYYGDGEAYTPYDEADKCKRCICGNDSKPSYCYSAICGPLSPGDCNGPFPDLCCNCQYNDPDTDPSEPSYLSASQRLIVSCMSVLVIVALLLFFSRNIAHRGRQNSLRHHHSGNRNPMSARYWVPQNDRNLPRNRSFFGRYLANSDSVSFFDQDGLPAVYIDLPPPYNTLKPPPSPDDASEDASPPPSYPASSSSNQPSPTRSLDNRTEPNPISSDEIPQTTENSQSPTPQSSSSDNPLLSSNPAPL